MSQPTAPGNRVFAGSRLLSIIGAVLLALTTAWWVIGLTQPIPRLAPGQPFIEGKRFTNILIVSFIGLDFDHNYDGARAWLRAAAPVPYCGPTKSLQDPSWRVTSTRSSCPRPASS